MSLEDYRKKRNFKRTPEPDEPLKEDGDGPLRFVVQKHKATRLHYDLRLELDGVLKSWAVPKGPSLNPADKKLAKKVEDHPLDYRNFEGIIPKGSYGAGTMIIWDEGYYYAPGAKDRVQSEKRLREGIKEGNLKFVLEGKKLRGEYVLVRMKNEGEDNWLLIKKNDSYASLEEVLNLDYSVRTGATLEEARAQNKFSAGETDNEVGIPAEELEKAGGKKAKMPTDLEPMLATFTKTPFDRKDWIFEIKWDGYRAIAEVPQNGKVRLYSRNKLAYEKEFPPVVSDLKKLDCQAIFDGEVVVVDQEGRGQIKLLQHYRKTGEGRLVYYVFDLLYYEGYDLRKAPLKLRKAFLRRILPNLPHLKYSNHVEEQGKGLYEAAKENELEGILAKYQESQYRTGVRSTEWLKIKAHFQQEAVIGGFTAPRGARSKLGALLLGVYEGKKLVYIGHAGGGFTDEDLKVVKSRLEPLVRKTSPFESKPATNAPPTWVEPELVCEVRFADWTNDLLMRHPIFLGLREDKDPKEVKRETPVSTRKVLEQKKFVKKDDERETVKIGRKSLELSNTSKVYWPEEGLTKGDMIAYYREIAPFILPYLVDRPQVLHRFPDGIHGKSFYHKDFAQAPEWLERISIESESKGGIVEYLLCQDEATLVYMANLGNIEFHPWNSSTKSLDNPDYMVIDLDPDERPFDDVIEAALVTREVFEKIPVETFVKTSGQRGMHVYVPLGSQYSYEQARQFAELICQMVHKRIPNMTSLVRSPKKRKGLIYLDYLQNRRGQTLVAPYSLRPKTAATVSTPLKWSEVKPGLSPANFTYQTIRPRLKKMGDLWEGVLKPGFDMKEALSILKNL
jgi:bifunctional non-homologous end joining protein LigD